VDVGAFRGAGTRSALRFFPNAYYSLIEPQEGLVKHPELLTNPRVAVHNVAAGPRAGTMKFTVHR